MTASLVRIGKNVTISFDGVTAGADIYGQFISAATLPARFRPPVHFFTCYVAVMDNSVWGVGSVTVNQNGTIDILNATLSGVFTSGVVGYTNFTLSYSIY